MQAWDGATSCPLRVRVADLEEELSVDIFALRGNARLDELQRS
jgi:hypothetical protein